MRRNSLADVGTMVIANLGVSIPVFVLGLLLAFVFAVLLKDTPFALPPSGRLTPGVRSIPLAEVWGLRGPDRATAGHPRLHLGMYILNALLTANWALFADALRHLILPAIALGTIPLAIIARMTRSSLLEVLGLDFVRTARAKGLKERSVVLRHGLRNAHAAGRDRHRALARRAPVRRGPDRDDLQPDRAWARRSSNRSTAATTSSSRARRSWWRVDLRRGQPRRGRVLRVPRPADPARLMATTRASRAEAAGRPDARTGSPACGATRSGTSCASARPWSA